MDAMALLIGSRSLPHALSRGWQFKMSERDYLEFLTANGYAPTQLNSTGAGTATMVDMDQTVKQHTEKNRSRRVSMGGRLNAIDET